MVGVAQLVERLTVAQVVVGSIPIAHPRFGKWRSLASVSALGAEGRGFESHLPDHLFTRGCGGMADALALGASGFTVGVQVPPPAPRVYGAPVAQLDRATAF